MVQILHVLDNFRDVSIEVEKIFAFFRKTANSRPTRKEDAITRLAWRTAKNEPCYRLTRQCLKEVLKLISNTCLTF